MTVYAYLRCFHVYYAHLEYRRKSVHVGTSLVKVTKLDCAATTFLANISITCHLLTVLPFYLILFDFSKARTPLIAPEVAHSI